MSVQFRILNHVGCFSLSMLTLPLPAPPIMHNTTTLHHEGSWRLTFLKHPTRYPWSPTHLSSRNDQLASLPARNWACCLMGGVTSRVPASVLAALD